MKSVFIVQHLRLLPDGQSPNIKLVGAYCTRAAASAAVEQLKVKPGFCDHPSLLDSLVDEAEQGFYIDEYELDKNYWSEGFA